LRDTDALTIDAVRGHQVEPPSEFRKDVPAELDQIVLQALSRERIVRFGTAHAFSEALDHFLAKRGNRPTSKSIGLWMESIFGSQRATLKKAIAQGRDVETALNLLPTIGADRSTTAESLGGAASVSSAQPRLLWSSRVASIHGPDPRASTFAGAPAPRPLGRGGDSLRGGGDSLRGEDFSANAAPRPPSDARGSSTSARTGLLVGAALALGLAVVGLLVVTRSRSTTEHVTPASVAAAPAATATASLDLKSEPSGAQILVDGDPSGLTTPAILKGLRAGRMIELRLDRVGFKPIIERIELKPGEAGARSFQLVEATGTVAIEGFPPQAIIYLDNNLVEGHGPLSVTIGEHRIRIETAAGVVLSETLNVVTGEQTVRSLAQRKGMKSR
jgi:hypothetical protein